MSLVFDVTRFGANSTADATAAIVAAIAAAAAARDRVPKPERRPVVLFPRARTFVTRPFNLSSGLVYQIDGVIEGATGNRLLRKRRWPTLPTLPSYGRDRDGAKSSRHQALVMAAHARDILLRGNGAIDGRGAWWWERRKSLRSGRPHLIELYNCSHVELTGLTLRDSPFWTLHPVYSSHIHIHDLTIRAPLYAPNTDGIDPDSCRHVMIERCDISVGDDHVAIKSGLSALAREAYPAFITQNVTVRHNTFRTGMGVSIGSETAGGIRDVLVHHNTFLGDGGWSVALHVKTSPRRGNSVERVSFRHNVVHNTTSFMRLEGAYQVRGPAAPPEGYRPTAVRHLSWINNSYSPRSRRTRSAWVCPRGSTCNHIAILNNTMGPHAKWVCGHIGREGRVVAGNQPQGLEQCMARSGSAPDRRQGSGKWKQFRWRGEEKGGGRRRGGEGKGRRRGGDEKGGRRRGGEAEAGQRGAAGKQRRSKQGRSEKGRGGGGGGGATRDRARARRRRHGARGGTKAEAESSAHASPPVASTAAEDDTSDDTIPLVARGHRTLTEEEALEADRRFERYAALPEEELLRGMRETLKAGGMWDGLPPKIT